MEFHCTDQGPEKLAHFVNFKMWDSPILDPCDWTDSWLVDSFLTSTAMSVTTLFCGTKQFMFLSYPQLKTSSWMGWVLLYCQRLIQNPPSPPPPNKPAWGALLELRGAGIRIFSQWFKIRQSCDCKNVQNWPPCCIIKGFFRFTGSAITVLCLSVWLDKARFSC